MISSRSGKETVALTVAGAALASSVALMSLYWSKKHQRVTRRALLQCACGQVKADIHQPAANYKYAEPTHLMCACNDCMGYCKAVLKEGSTEEDFQKSFFDPAVPTILFYDSEISVKTGKENLEHMKLSRKTENRRVFAKCCGTPLSVSPDHSHLNLVFSNLVTPAKDWDCQENEAPFPESVLKTATCCLEVSQLGSSAQAQLKTQFPTMKLIAAHVAPVEMLKIVARLGLLIAMGARGPGEGFPVGPGKTVGIGYQAIPKQMKK